MGREGIHLDKWLWGLGENEDCLEYGKEVIIPHTWNIVEGSEDYWGIGWYEYKLLAAEDWKNKRVFIKFQAVYHNAVVYLNGKEVGRHENSGYTPFTIELTKGLLIGTKNVIRVKVNNEPSENMLPYKRSFDWANDGGIIRGVKLYVTGSSKIASTRITATPIIVKNNTRQDEGYGTLDIDLKFDGNLEKDLSLVWKLYKGCDQNLELIKSGVESYQNGNIIFKPLVLQDISYWHFDHPNLYTIRLTLKTGDKIEDEVLSTFGFRDFHVRANSFYLNGEKVRLCGTEWMPGSDPDYGMAETQAQLEKMLRILKESNCVYTRFHWQQDDMVYDWCDRHGMLVQEEIPYWGRDPEVAGEQQWINLKEQVEEMIAAHYHHPSIVSWGVGNELDAQAEETIQYIKDAVAYTHKLDETRLAVYVSNSFFEDPKKDGTTDSDIMMINDYIGTWTGQLDQYEELQKMLKANPDKPMVPSEFGLCEPFWPGGDERRTKIFLEKMAAYRQFEGIAGTINFCLNDYRTQMGEDGEGKWKKRIHGSTNLTGEPKPSYYVVQQECAPFAITWKESRLIITCKDHLPCHMMKGYCGEVVDQNGECVEKIMIPELKPGDRWEKDIDQGEQIAIYRPNGDFAGIYDRS